MQIASTCTARELLSHDVICDCNANAKTLKQKQPTKVVVVLQFIYTLQTNIRAKVGAIVNIKIDKVDLGSILVTNTATFTDANFETAIAGQNALVKVLESGDLTGIFGTQYGDVTVEDVKRTDAANPSKSRTSYLPWFMKQVLSQPAELLSYSYGHIMSL